MHKRREREREERGGVRRMEQMNCEDMEKKNNDGSKTTEGKRLCV